MTDATPLRMERLHVCQRIRILRRGPESLEFYLLYDKERELWLGQKDRWADLNDGTPIIGAEGATPAEVLRKLADMLDD
jgi:hypothetical protein